MRRSKLESCQDVLEALSKEPSTVDSIAYETNMECRILKRYLGFLIKNGLVSEQILNNERLYVITERGMAVFKALSSQKYLEKVANTIKAINET